MAAASADGVVMSEPGAVATGFEREAFVADELSALPVRAFRVIRG